jgi:hypothetical protein
MVPLLSQSVRKFRGGRGLLIFGKTRGQRTIFFKTNRDGAQNYTYDTLN